MSKKTWHIWTPGDPIPEDLPAAYEYFDSVDGRWYNEGAPYNGWPEDMKYFQNPRRWPAEPVKGPTAFGLLSEVEKGEIKAAWKRGELEYFDGGSWVTVGLYFAGSKLIKNHIYRIKEPKPQKLEVTVSLNGKPVDPKTLSVETRKALMGLGGTPCSQ